MAKFTFRLQSYLGVKEQMEELKKNEYGMAMRRLEEERQKKEALEQEVVQNVLFFKEALGTSIEPVEIRRYNNRIEILKTWIVQQKERVEAAAKYAEEKRLELVEAMKDRKALETVKERNYEEYLKDEQKAERVVVDGIVSYQYSNVR